MINSDIIKQLLKTYKFDNHLPPEVKNRLLKAKCDTLIEIFKKHGKYSLLVMFAVLIFFWVKKFGIGFSIAKCLLIATAVSVASAGIIATGTIITLKKAVIDNPVEIKEQNNDVKQIKEENKESIKNVTHDKIQLEPKKTEEIIYKLAVVPFEFDGDSKIAKTITSTIVKNLVRLKGKSAATFYSGIAVRKQADNMIYGSISKLGNTYHISVRIVDSKNSNVKLYITEKVKSKDDMESACYRISKKIAKRSGVL